MRGRTKPNFRTPTTWRWWAFSRRSFSTRCWSATSLGRARSTSKPSSTDWRSEPMDTAVPLLHDFLIQSSRRLPSKIALVSQGRRIAYDELDKKSNALAHALVRAGVHRGDRVVVFADNTVEAVISFWGVLKADAVVSMVNPQTK